MAYLRDFNELWKDKKMTRPKALVVFPSQINLKDNNQTTFTNTEIRRNLRVKESTLRNYNNQLFLEGYIQKVKGKKGQTYHYEIIDINEYTNLKSQINTSLHECITAINLASSQEVRK